MGLAGGFSGTGGRFQWDSGQFRRRAEVGRPGGFLGFIGRIWWDYAFYRSRKLKRYIPTVHAKSKKRLADSLRLILARNRKESLEEIKESLRTKLTGWAAYFRWAHFQSWARGMDEWIRRRIRQLLWRTWKKVRTRYRALRRLGCEHRTAMMWANTRKGSWRIANSQVLAATLRNDFLKAHGWVWLNLVAKPVEWKK